MSDTEKTEKKNKGSIKHTVLSVVGIVLCVLLIPIIVINCTLLVKRASNKDEVPSVFGVFPMIVLTDSMKGTFDSGDLIICQSIDAKDVQEGDIICFFDPSSNSGSTVTHRVIGFSQAPDGSIVWVTKGDANNTADRVAVPQENLVGVYKFKIKGLGTVAMFMQSTSGFIICIAAPIVLLLAYDFVRRRAAEKQRIAENEVLQAQIAALKAEKNGNTINNDGENNQ